MKPLTVLQKASLMMKSSLHLYTAGSVEKLRMNSQSKLFWLNNSLTITVCFDNLNKENLIRGD